MPRAPAASTAAGLAAAGGIPGCFAFGLKPGGSPGKRRCCRISLCKGHGRGSHAAAARRAVILHFCRGVWNEF
jgi:hypothetical protein